jgi:endonuclease/exonuclease/phosphatase (EEP) superfamily protein YafD
MSDNPDAALPVRRRSVNLEGFYRLTWASIVLSLTNWLPTIHVVQEINVNFSHYYLGLHCLSLLIVPLYLFRFGFRKVLLMTFALLTLITGYLVWFRPFLIMEADEDVVVNQPVEARAPGVLRIYYANVFGPNTNYEGVSGVVDLYTPDFVALTEVTPAWADGLKFREQYPYQKVIPRYDNFGIALYSKYPFLKDPLISVGDELPPVILVDLKLDDTQHLTFGVVHALPPQMGDSQYRNMVLLRRFASQVRHNTGPVVVVGDLNAMPVSIAYRRFLFASRLSNVWEGLGLPKTWNALLPGTWFMLDHVLINAGVKRKAISVLPANGSDHLPYLFDFALPPSPHAGYGG